MTNRNPDPWEEEIEALIQELIVSGLLTGDLEAEVESLLDGGFYCSAGLLTVRKDLRTDTLAD